jgi:hypothetical protein
MQWPFPWELPWEDLGAVVCVCPLLCMYCFKDESREHYNQPNILIVVTVIDPLGYVCLFGVLYILLEPWTWPMSWVWTNVLKQLYSKILVHGTGEHHKRWCYRRWEWWWWMCKCFCMKGNKHKMKTTNSSLFVCRPRTWNAQCTCLQPHNDDEGERGGTHLMAMVVV